MRKLLIALGLLAAWSASASAQCVGVGSVNTVPQTGLVCEQESTVPTYYGASFGLTPGATPTDIACLTGSATKVVRVKRVRVSGTAAAAINITALLIKHAVADTLGTQPVTLATGLPSTGAADTQYPTVTATMQAYTANPTINDTSPQTVSAQTVFLPVTSTASGGSVNTWDYGVNGAVSPPVLRGVAQQLCVNLNGVTTPNTGLMTVAFEWTETAQ